MLNKKIKKFQKQPLSTSTVCIVYRVSLKAKTSLLGITISVKNTVGAVAVDFNAVGPAVYIIQKSSNFPWISNQHMYEILNLK